MALGFEGEEKEPSARYGGLPKITGPFKERDKVSIYSVGIYRV